MVPASMQGSMIGVGMYIMGVESVVPVTTAVAETCSWHQQ